MRKSMGMERRAVFAVQHPVGLPGVGKVRETDGG